MDNTALLRSYKSESFDAQGEGNLDIGNTSESETVQKVALPGGKRHYDVAAMAHNAVNTVTSNPDRYQVSYDRTTYNGGYKKK